VRVARDSRQSSSHLGTRQVLVRRPNHQAVPCDERAYFESFYAATVRGQPTDRMTIGMVTEI
jgi:hypothetical protein